jgi:glycosyltransferase involved in cell wall biosynthesis
LFEPGDFADLARKMQRLWDDPELCRRMGAAARAKAVARWSHDRNYDQTYDLYRRVVATGARTR